MNSEMRTGWLCRTNEKPDYEGVYECRDASVPNAPITFCLYKDGWHVGYETIEAARRATEKFVKPSIEFEIRGRVKVWTVGKNTEDQNNEPKWEWRGLAKKPSDWKIVASDKWKKV